MRQRQISTSFGRLLTILKAKGKRRKKLRRKCATNWWVPVTVLWAITNAGKYWLDEKIIRQVAKEVLFPAPKRMERFRHAKRFQVSPKPSHSLRGSLMYRLNHYEPWIDNEHVSLDKGATNNVYINFMENCENENTEGNRFAQDGKTGYVCACIGRNNLTAQLFRTLTQFPHNPGVSQINTWRNTQAIRAVWRKTAQTNFRQTVKISRKSTAKIGKCREKAYGAPKGAVRILLRRFWTRSINTVKTRSIRSGLIRMSKRFVFRTLIS